jgi:erythromycin esterase-like protein
LAHAFSFPSFRVRAFISQHLLQHRGFDFVAVEGDHPDTYQLNRYVQMHEGCSYRSAEEAMSGYKRFPRQ